MTLKTLASLMTTAKRMSSAHGMQHEVRPRASWPKEDKHSIMRRYVLSDLQDVGCPGILCELYIISMYNVDRYRFKYLY